MSDKIDELIDFLESKKDVIDLSVEKGRISFKLSEHIFTFFSGYFLMDDEIMSANNDQLIRLDNLFAYLKRQSDDKKISAFLEVAK